MARVMMIAMKRAVVPLLWIAALIASHMWKLPSFTSEDLQRKLSSLAYYTPEIEKTLRNDQAGGRLMSAPASRPRDRRVGVMRSSAAISMRVPELTAG